MFDIWLDEFGLSSWAFHYCYNNEDYPNIRRHITSSHHAYAYCRFIKDLSEIRYYIKDSFDALLYCKYVRDDINWIKKLASSRNF